VFLASSLKKYSFNQPCYIAMGRGEEGGSEKILPHVMAEVSPQFKTITTL
jgi:hypothetical protein